MSRRRIPQKKETWLAEKTLSALGLGKIVDAAKQSPLFKARFEEVNTELRQRLSKKTFFEPPEHSKKPLVDVINEKNRLRVIVGWDKLREDELKIKLGKRVLVIQAGKQRKKIKLPCPATKIEGRAYKNGILEVRLSKA